MEQSLTRALFAAPNAAALLREVGRAARQINSADGATFVLRDGGECCYAEEDAVSPLWKGRRFPLGACISGWVMLNKVPAIIPDVYLDVRIPVDAYRPTFVKSLVMVPVRTKAPVGAIGNYWASRHHPTQSQVNALQSLADAVGAALEDPQLYAELRSEVLPA
jgi:GAF domain-containing protein